MDKRKERIITYLDRVEEIAPIWSNTEGWDGNGKFYGLFQAIGDILRECDASYRRINYLERKIEEISSEKWKDEELKSIKENLDRVREDAGRGFPITEEEEKAIQDWESEHLKKKHPKAVRNPSHFGAIGGNFSYEFIPTSIGVIGKVKCSCGKEFCFRELT